MLDNKTWAIRAATVGLISMTLGSIFAESAMAQRRIAWLTSTSCIKTNWSLQTAFYPHVTDVAVGRELFTSYIEGTSSSSINRNSSASLTCKISAGRAGQQYESLQLSFARADRSGGADPRITVFLDGNEAKSADATLGKKKELLLDVKNVKSVEVEISCPHNTVCANVYFFRAYLDPGIRSPGSR